MELRRCSTLVLGLVLCWASSGAAQDAGLVEGGLGTVSVFARIGSTSIIVTEAGLYAGALGRVGERFGVYGSVGAIYGGGTFFVGKAGAEARLGPSGWIARPALRGGVAVVDGSPYGTGGWGLTVGRRYGLRYTVDVSRQSGLWWNTMHVGAYVAF